MPLPVDNLDPAAKLRAEATAFLEQWTTAVLARDRAAALDLRTEDSIASLPGTPPLNREQEIDFFDGQAEAVQSLEVELREATADHDRADIAFELRARMIGSGATPENLTAQCSMELRRRADGGWRVRRLVVHLPDQPPGAPDHDEPVRRPSLKARILRKFQRGTHERETFPRIAYLPYRPAQDYLLPPREPGSAIAGEADLPIPPPELWLGYNYPAHGKMHVDTMLAQVSASGFELADGDRILDLGCGAGRMIRHLLPLAQRCEVWGADISAEHIFWCKRNLSPPFNFLTTTKVPHLPFADGSFRFVYCGSLFTHIDDLAEAWLLELRRILASGGRLYVTIHDEHTFALLDEGSAPPAVMRHVFQSPIAKEARAGFDMFTVGRDDLSQVFHSRAHFTRMAEPGFELLSATPEAYFYQTAMLFAAR